MMPDITPCQTSDYVGFDPVMDDNLTKLSVLLADRGYASDKVRKAMEARNVMPVIPMRRSRKMRVAVDSGPCPLPAAQPRRAMLQQAEE